MRFFGAADAALGREIDAARTVVVAGVAEQTRHYGLDQPHEYAIYLPIEALPSGVFLGGVVAVFVGRLLESWLFGVSGTDPIALTSAALVLFVTAVAASWFPAYRAGKTDPLETLKAE